MQMPEQRVLTWMHFTGKVLWLQAHNARSVLGRWWRLGAVMSCYVLVEERYRPELFEYSVSSRQSVEKTTEGQGLYKICERAEFCVH